jgi:3'-phosphoadenosine 5'-phosphosulfate (PAPS) 3'-phosphatase
MSRADRITDNYALLNNLHRLIDPLDGTKEFINRNDEFTCNLALVEDHQPTLGFESITNLRWFHP